MPNATLTDRSLLASMAVSGALTRLRAMGIGEERAAEALRTALDGVVGAEEMEVICRAVVRGARLIRERDGA